MSDAKDDFYKNIEQDAALERKHQEIKNKELQLKEHRVNNALERLTQDTKDLEFAKAVDYGKITSDRIAYLQKENADYMEAAKKPMLFINRTFNGIVPFFRKNLILICGKTGEGKSTTVANIVYSTIGQINPDTGKPKRVLVITNEEKAEDFYNRVTCLARGWHYVNHDQFTNEQVAEFQKMIAFFGKTGVLQVIDNNYEGGNGLTTTIEGLESIFDGLIARGEYYDAIVIDYYQNFKYSKKDPSLTEWQVQEKVAGKLDQYKNVYPAPIVMLAQCLPTEDDKLVPIEFRIKGRKVITDPSTLIMEMVANRDDLRTKWIVHKSRFTRALGQSFETGYDNGKFVEINRDFLHKVNMIKEQRQWAKIGRNIFEDKKEAENGSNNQGT